MRRWHVVSALAKQEIRADENLKRQGFESWLPQFRKKRRHARRTEETASPLFPGYLFVRFDVETDRWRSINGTFGVVRVLCNCDEPIAVPDELVANLQARKDEAGFISLPVRNFKAGESVHVATGPFADLEGLFERTSGRDRVVLLFSLLGQKVRAKVRLVELAA